jgi:L-histidine Nalpha-methyltransferase
MEIYLETMRPQTATLSLLNLQVKLANGERIHTENSYKYTIPMVRALVKPAGFVLEQTWFDKQKWFALHLARVK